MAVAAVEWQAQGINAWEALPEQDHEATELMVGALDKESMREDSVRRYTAGSNHQKELARLAHGTRTLFDENCRAPVVWAYNLREKILESRHPESKIFENRPMIVPEELKILGLVDQFTVAFQGLKALITTPFPFPLVQMTRTFLFCWVFTLPLVLAADNDDTYEVLAVMFFCAYGFFGLEITSNEMTDAFGTDPNDLPVQYVSCLLVCCIDCDAAFVIVSPRHSCYVAILYRRWAENVFEDIYIFIYKTDGYESAMKLRSRITKRIALGSSFDENDQRDADHGSSFWSLSWTPSGNDSARSFNFTC